MFRIGVVGANGRMGQAVVRQVAALPTACLAAACDRPGAPALGRDAGVLVGLDALGIVVGDSAAAVFAAADVVIDFTAPSVTAVHAALAVEHRCALVVGTTGLTPEIDAALHQAAEHTVIVAAPNMSQGVTLLNDLVRRVAQALDPAFDIEIVEMHHRHKVDAPSGTALGLGRAAAAGRGVALDQAAVRVRDGITGPRRTGSIGFATLRGGDVVGDHLVIFAGDGERIELAHKASDRSIFAKGAVRAALWTAGRAPGLYGMVDVLGL